MTNKPIQEFIEGNERLKLASTYREFILDEILPPGGTLNFDLDKLGIEIRINGRQIYMSDGEGIVFTFTRKKKEVTCD